MERWIVDIYYKVGILLDLEGTMEKQHANIELKLSFIDQILTHGVRPGAHSWLSRYGLYAN